MKYLLLAFIFSTCCNFSKLQSAQKYEMYYAGHSYVPSEWVHSDNCQCMNENKIKKDIDSIIWMEKNELYLMTDPGTPSRHVYKIMSIYHDQEMCGCGCDMEYE